MGRPIATLSKLHKHIMDLHMRLRAKLCHAMCGHLKIMCTWQQRGCRCWTAAEGGFDQDAISAIAQPSFVHICQFFRFLHVCRDPGGDDPGAEMCAQSCQDMRH